MDNQMSQSDKVDAIKTLKNNSKTEKKQEN